MLLDMSNANIDAERMKLFRGCSQTVLLAFVQHSMQLL